MYYVSYAIIAEVACEALRRTNNVTKQSPDLCIELHPSPPLFPLNAGACCRYSTCKSSLQRKPKIVREEKSKIHQPLCMMRNADSLLSNTYLVVKCKDYKNHLITSST